MRNNLFLIPGLTTHAKNFLVNALNDYYSKYDNYHYILLSFHKKNRHPSNKLKTECIELAKKIKLVSSTNEKNIVIAKSLGGVIATTALKLSKTIQIDKLIILGLPIVLGYPPNINLLKDNSPFSNYVSEYIDLFKNLKNKEIHIIQGNEDDLCPIDDLLKITLDYKNIKIHVIKGGNHDFDCCKKTEYKNLFKIIEDKINLI
ncbi:MAG: hypothetical protein HYW86_04210 [Candidatus Roizmanbacteria bacterium]|nr:MAG: hypothetical protein HYW86_04210 [Candidatus Roizmanbacteria bacterium]